MEYRLFTLSVPSNMVSGVLSNHVTMGSAKLTTIVTYMKYHYIYATLELSLR